MGSVVGYTCPSCGFDTSVTNCDKCDAVVKWDSVVHGNAHCTGCGMAISMITCRKCSYKFNL
jgi:hypothetical protein